MSVEKNSKGVGCVCACVCPLTVLHWKMTYRGECSDEGKINQLSVALKTKETPIPQQLACIFLA